MPPTTTPPPDKEEGTLLLVLPEQAESGQPLTLTATLLNEKGEPIESALVTFSIEIDFFTSYLMEIGQAVTNEQGVAVLEYTSRQAGDIQVIARYEGDGIQAAEAAATIILTEADEPFYQAEVGLHSFSFGEEVFIGPESALDPVGGNAPTSAFRLPGGILSWLLLLVATVLLIWFTYFRVLYQVFRIPIVSEIKDTNLRLVPMIGMTIIVAVGLFLALMLLTGPYSHFHVLP